MKRLLVLAIILAMASMAGATVTMSVSSNTVAVGGAITVSIYSSDTSEYSKYLDLTNAATFGNVVIYPAAGEYAGVDYSPNALTLYAIGSPTAGLHFDIETIATGNINDTFTIDLVNGDTFEIEDSQTVTIIPEPLTITLLCFGGLMLRRRK
jgi:hypothetical protein